MDRHTKTRWTLEAYKARCRKERLLKSLQQLYLDHSRSPSVNPEPLLIETRGHCLELTMTSASGPPTLHTKKAVQSYNHLITRERDVL